MNEMDRQHLRTAIAVSRSAHEHGNCPYGAILVDEHGKVLLEAENTQLTEHDCTNHAETNLMREATRKYAPEVLARCTVYASGEPCAMCAGALYWGGVNRLVYALGLETMNELAGEAADRMYLSCRDVLSRGDRKVEVLGPALEDEARKVLDAD